MHQAAKYNNWRAVNLFLEAGVDLEYKDKKGRTPIVYAVDGKKWNMVKRLLDKGANTNVLIDSSKGTVRYFIRMKYGA